jgi:catechol 2,3-dioxygenase-like lactoylglutathione lyase family enzyme
MDVFADQGNVRAIYHVSVGVSDIERARLFYGAILLPLGYKLLYEVKEQGKITSLGWGLHFPELWTNLPLGGATPHPGSGIHVAFHAPNADAVDRFHAAALSAGATDNGPPGYRVDYDPGYYGAFVLDPDRNKLEAMWFDHQRASAVENVNDTGLTAA